MKLRRLEVEYFMCFGPKFILEFPEVFNIMIVGCWENETHRSNWSGKSTFIEAIKFLLFGEARNKYLKEIPNDNFKKPARVSGIIEVDGKEIEIIRVVQKNTSTLEVRGWESQEKKVTQAKLNELFGCSYDDFVHTCFFNQGDIHQFMKAKSSDKLLLLERWMEVENWDASEEEAKERKKHMDNKLKEIKDSIERKDTYEKSLVLARREITSKKQKLSELRKSELIIKQEISSIKEKLFISKNAKDLLRKKQELDTKFLKLGDLLDLERKYEFIKLEIRNLDAAIGQNKDNACDLPVLRRRLLLIEYKITELEKKVTLVTAEIKLANNTLENIGDGEKCPIDKVKCSRSKEILRYRAKLQKQKTSSQEQLKGLAKEHGKLRAEFAAVQLVIADKRNSEEQISKSLLKRETFCEQVKRLQDKIRLVKELEKEMDDLPKIVDIKEARVLRTRCENLTLEHEKALNGIEYLIEELGALRQEVRHAKECLVTVRRDRVRAEEYKKRKEALAFCIYMFGRNGIRSSQLKNRMESIEVETNEILDALDCKLQIEIETERELGAWESFCIYCGKEFSRGYSKRKCSTCNNLRQRKKREEFDIKILNGGRTRSFNQESGGLQVLTSLAIRLSLIKIRQRISGKNLSILFLDEIYGMLDSVNREQVYMLLLNYAKNKLGFNQIFQVSLSDEGQNEGLRVEILKKQKYSEAKFSPEV